MKAIVCHNYYQQAGGEDQSFAHEANLLEERGHEVIRFTKHNDEINQMSRMKTAFKTLWNQKVYSEIRDLIRHERPDVMHCTNTFPLISPAVYYAAQREGVAVVQSLRNYRLLCPGAYLLRNGTVCEDCLGKRIPWPSIVHGCYRSSRVASTVVSGMLAFHHMRTTWQKMVDVFYALTEFGRRKFIQGGLPAQKIAVKPNFIHPDPGPGNGNGGYALFVGRLSEEKGVDMLLKTWATLPVQLRLIIAGDGPLASRVRAAASRDDRISWVGWRSPREISTLIGDALTLIVSSLWYEGQPRTMLEAYARGTPIIAPQLGSMAEMVDDGITGHLFPPGDIPELARSVERFVSNRQNLSAMRSAARREFETKYSAERNYEMLMRIYQRALNRESQSTADLSEVMDNHVDPSEPAAHLSN